METETRLLSALRDTEKSLCTWRWQICRPCFRHVAMHIHIGIHIHVRIYVCIPIYIHMYFSVCLYMYLIHEHALFSSAHICIFGSLSHLSSQVRRRVGKVAVPPESSWREDAAPCCRGSEVGKGRLGCLSVCVRFRPPCRILCLQNAFQHISLAALNAPVNVKWFIAGFRRIQQDDHCVGK